jgi:RNA polymerase sigma factor (sigma-70 family)
MTREDLLNSISYATRVLQKRYRRCPGIDIEDCIQLAFVKGWQKFSMYQGDTQRSLDCWFISIAINEARDIKRKEACRPTVQMVYNEVDCAKYAHDPRKAIVTAGQVEWVRKSIEKLEVTRPKWALAMKLYYFEGLDFAEMEERLGEPYTTLKIRVFRGREKLKLWAMKDGLIKETGNG